MSSLNNPHTSSLNNPTTARRRVPIAIAAICGLAAPLLAVVHTPAPAQVAAGYTVMHRLYNPNSGEHFYTASTYERDAVVRAGWKYEGEGWTAPTVGIPSFRLRC